ncbi:MAG: hypothetical protein U5N86_08730 [Planctomycetota bacterium]|nr:hypothetical protein [Planctomycetota bacterium]
MRYLFEDSKTRQAIRFAHISAVIPLWGPLVTAVCYKFISRHAPERRPSIVEAFVWQAALNLFHALCLLVTVGVTFAFSDKAFFVTAFNLTVLVIWLVGFTFALLTSFSAASRELSGKPFRYPVVSSFIRTRSHESKPAGSVFYPFGDSFSWK